MELEYPARSVPPEDLKTLVAHFGPRLARLRRGLPAVFVAGRFR